MQTTDSTARPLVITRLLSLSLSLQALSLVCFICFAASNAASFVTVPLLEFLAALFLLFAYSTKFNERFKGFLWPLMVRAVAPLYITGMWVMAA